MNDKRKIDVLVIEDDVNLGAMLKDNMILSGYQCHLYNNGGSGLEAFKNSKFDLCIFDVMLPVKDGFELAKEVRRQDSKVPIIFLTAKNSENDRVAGFKIGADDYVTKPFSYTELSLRIEAILKRTGAHLDKENQKEIYKAGQYTFDYAVRTLSGIGESKTLTFKEAEILKIFFSQPNVLVNRSHIMNTVWHNDDYVISKSLDVYLTKIRKLIKADPSLEIENLYGTGYMLVVKEPAA
jgi:DNA-binding response OmpR family regulator